MSKKQEDFTWDNAPFGDDAFGTKGQAETSLETFLEEKDEENTQGTEGTKTPEQIEAEEEALKNDVFRDLEEGGEEEQEEEDNKGEEDKGAKPGKPAKVSPIKQTLNVLSEIGIVDAEDDTVDFETMSEEEIKEYIADKHEESIDDALTQTIQELPDVLKQLIKIAKDGGNVMQTIAGLAVAGASGLVEGMELSDEATQERALRAILRSEGEEDEEIDARIDYLKNNGKLEALAQKKYDKWSSEQSAKRETEAKAAKDRKDTAVRQQREYKKAVSTFVAETKEIKGYTLPTKLKKDLADFMGEPSVELKDGRVVTPMMSAYYAAMADKEKSVLLAAILKSDFDFSTIVASKVTQETRNNRRALENTENMNKPSNGSSQRVKTGSRPAWDYL